MPVWRQLHLHAVQLAVQVVGVIGDFAHVVQAIDIAAGIEIVGASQSWLGGGTQHHGHAVVFDQQFERAQNGVQERGGQLLGFVQHDDAARQVVQFAAAGCFGRKQRLEQLHVGGDHQRCVPVLAGQAAAGSFSRAGRIGLAVVLDQHLIAQRGKHAPEHVGGLLNDAGVGNGVNDAALAVFLRVLQREGEAGKCFAAARGHGEREEARLQQRLGPALAQDVGTQGVDRGVWCRCCFRGHVLVKRNMHLRQGGKTASAGGFACVEVSLGIQKVGIHQARKQHAHPQGKAILPAGNARGRRQGGVKNAVVCRWHLGKGAFKLFQAVCAFQAFVQTAVPVLQTNMVACNQVGQHMAQGQGFGLVELLDCPQCSGGRVGFFAPADAVLNVTIRVI